MTDSHRISIIGGQGKFGNALQKHLKEMHGSSIIVEVTNDKLHNAEIASISDVVILTLPSRCMETVLKEIKPVLKSTAGIISFAANYPLESICKRIEQPVARVMADPFWNLSAIMSSSDSFQKELDVLFHKFTRKKTIILHSDKEMDEFTISMSYIFVVLLMEKMGLIKNADEHLDFAGKYTHTTPEEAREFLPQKKSKELFTLMATKGGVSESIFQLLNTNPHVQAMEVFVRILKKTATASHFCK